MTYANTPTAPDPETQRAFEIITGDEPIRMATTTRPVRGVAAIPEVADEPSPTLSGSSTSTGRPFGAHLN